MTAETIARALGGHPRAQHAWPAARCMRIETQAFQPVRGRMAKCWCAAMPAQHDLIAALQRSGLWQTTWRALGIACNHRRGNANGPDADALKRGTAALAIWQASRGIEGAPVATYLRSRGLDLPALPVLRFHAGLKHSSGGVWPAMVALVTYGAAGSGCDHHALSSEDDIFAI
jgi:putative DNA primase/helicase